MPSLIFMHPDGRREVVDARDGETVMEAAVMNGVEGIIADCGGALSCATCHVYLTPASPASIPEVSEYEDAMLEDAASERRPLSRLSCQIRVSIDLDGLVVEIPPEQV